jgi:hypothetical protein
MVVASAVVAMVDPVDPVETVVRVVALVTPHSIIQVRRQAGVFIQDQLILMDLDKGTMAALKIILQLVEVQVAEVQVVQEMRSLQDTLLVVAPVA